MRDSVFVVKLRVENEGIYSVRAQRTEIHGDHLVLLNASGAAVALFVIDTVESWIELPRERSSPPA